MAFISEEEINSIKSKANIVDIIGGYIPLTKVGTKGGESDYVGVCPFHDDHSPSMRVSTKLNIFKCFVCNTGGNVFSFVSKFENVPYYEAIRIVANKVGINVNLDTRNLPTNKFKNEYELMGMSHRFYQNILATADGLKAKEYLMSRGITDDIINKFKIGLSPGNNELLKYFENKNANLEMGYNLGLLNKSGIDYYDMFVNRVMIPIHDMQGNLVGYTGRAYLKDEKNKYINTKDTVIYKKSNILFNYYNAKDQARLEKTMILVEGNMDVISMAASGISNVCALMGVAISKVQIDALKRLNAKIVLLLDSDSAGDAATIKVGEEIYKEGLDLRVVRLSGAKDPDEYIRKFGKEKLLDNIKHAGKYLDYKVAYLKESKNLNNIDDLTGYVKEVIASLENASELEKEVVIAKLANDYNLDASILRSNIKEKKAEIKEEPVIVSKKKSKYDMAVSELIYAMLLNKRYYKIYMAKLGYLKNKVERDIVSCIGGYIKKYGDIDIAGFIDYIIGYEEMSNYLNSNIIVNYKETVAENEFCDILYTVLKCINEEEIKELKMEIKLEQDVAKKLELIEKLTELKRGSGNNEGN